MVAVSDLLVVWESGIAAGTVQRTLLLHALARPESDVDDLLDVPVGARDGELFALRRELFGAWLPVRLGCPACEAELEFDFDTGLVAKLGRPPAKPIEVVAGEWRVVFTLPTSGDLLAAAEAVTTAEGRDILLSRCVLEVTRAGTPVPVAELPGEVQHGLSERAALADPGADIRLDVGCPECGQAAKAELDIGSCLWAELDTWARAMLLDVHLLAGTYGWAETDILALSPLRRSYYLELAGYG